MSTHNSRDTAREFISRGYAPVPIAKGEKAPHLSGWQKLKVSIDQVDELFGTDSNIGLLLGEHSGGLVDVDLDAMESLPLASHFLPRTGMVHGRKSKPNSHYWYIATESEKTKQFKDVDGSSLVELRSTGGQTVIPPSVHPSGEQLTWSYRDSPAEVPYPILLRHTQRLAAATLLVRHYPQQGSRQELAMALSGALIKSGWSVNDTKSFIEAVCRAAGDEELSSRIATVERTHEKQCLNEPITGINKISELIGSDVVKKLCEWLSLTSPRPDNENKRKETKDFGQSQLDQIVALGQQVELFHSTHKEAYALIKHADHSEVWALRSSGFKSWICKKYFEEHHKAPRKNALQEAIDCFYLNAMHTGDERPVFLRAGELGGKLYLDLGTPEWEVIEIDTDGWRITKSPVLFYRPNDFGQLPIPKEGGDLLYFKHLLNTSSDTDLKLMISWILSTLLPVGPYPVLILQGEAGSAKSTTAKILRRIIDPCEVTLRSLPRNERDMMIAAKNNRINAWDNLSGLKNTTSDIICRMATGGGFATRALYENDEEILFSIQRPILMNGIDDIALRQDLVDRAIVITLPVISDTERKDEKTLWKNFDQCHPWLLGYVLSAASTGLRRLSDIHLPSVPRMADFCRWASACETALGWNQNRFLEAFHVNRSDALNVSIEADLVATAIIDFLNINPDWSGTASELLSALNKVATPDHSRSKYWPKTASILSNCIHKSAQGIRNSGFDIQFSKSGKRWIKVKRIEKHASNSVLRPVLTKNIDTPDCDNRPQPLDKQSNSRTVDDMGAVDAMDAMDATYRGTPSAGWAKELVGKVFFGKKNHNSPQHNEQHTAEHNSSTPATTPTNTQRDTK